MTIQAASAIIDGVARTGSGATFEVIDPATETTITAFHDAGDDLVAEAAASARRAFDAGVWRGLPVEARQQALLKAADAVEAAGDELARLETANTGLPFHHVRGRLVARAAHNFRFFAHYAGQSAGKLFEQAPEHLTFVKRSPVGVAGLIAPWNAPIALGSMKLAAALAFGNSCVIKPSEQAPLGLQRFVEILLESGVPAGVVNLVNGGGATTGAALVRSRDVDVVSFTGGTSTGRAIMAAAGAALKPTTMELGGKSANIIFEDADLERAIDAALLGIFSSNGQQCLAGSRILVQRAVADRFIAAFAARARNLRIGDPFDPATELGPVASRAQMERILDFAAGARAAGAQCLAGGGRAPGFTKGYYIEPIVMRTEDHGAAICQEEIFGPFATILVFDTIDEAFRLANASRFGLVSYVWSENVHTIMRAQEELESGVVWINTPMMRELRAPFGGWKESGVGAEGGPDCEAFYTRQKTVTLARRPLRLQRLGA